MKLIGGALVVVSSSWIGFLIANQFVLRPQQLHQLQTALQMLETEISYGITPLPEAFNKLASNLSNPIDKIFKLAQQKLNEGYTAPEAWSIALKEVFPQTELNKEDQQVLLDLGHNLGQSTSDDQLKYLNLVQRKLEGLYQEAIDERQVKVKLWRYLGVLTGLFLVILIF